MNAKILQIAGPGPISGLHTATGPDLGPLAEWAVVVYKRHKELPGHTEENQQMQGRRLPADARERTYSRWSLARRVRVGYQTIGLSVCSRW